MPALRHARLSFVRHRFSGSNLRELRRGVESVLVSGQRHIEEAKVRTYWETGRLIQEHLRLNGERADYGAQLVPRLGLDLGVSHSVLYRCVRFAAAFPILAARPQLSWAHYRLLIQLEDRGERKTIAAQAVKNEWTSRELEQRVRLAVARSTPPLAANGGADGPGETSQAAAGAESRPQPLVPKQGTVGIYRLVAHDEGLAVDLGFTSYRDLTPAEAEGLKAGGLVRLDARGGIEAADGVRQCDRRSSTRIRRKFCGWWTATRSGWKFRSAGGSG